MQLAASPLLDSKSVTEIAAPKISGLNRKIYRRLKLALSLELRRQIFIVACDDLLLRDRLALSLQEELNHPSLDVRNGVDSEPSEKLDFPRLVSLRLSLRHPDPFAQISKWLAEHPQPKNAGSVAAVPSLPAFQIWGVEQLTRQPPAVQWSFINYLQEIDSASLACECNLVLWVPQPWLVSIQQSAPEFWNLRTGVFEFEGDPTPSPLANAGHDTLYHETLYHEERTAHSQSRNPHFRIARASEKWTSEVPSHAFAAAERENWAEQLVRDSADAAAVADASNRSISQPKESFGFSNISASDKTSEEESVLLAEEEASQEASREIRPSHDTTEVGDSADLENSQPRALAAAAEPSREKNQPEENVEIGDINQTLFLENLFVLLAEETQNNVHFQAIAELAHLVKDAASEEVSWGAPLLQKQSLQTLQAIARSYQEAASPNAIASSYHRLGDLWRDRVERGDSSPQTLTIAIRAYEQMLEVLQGVAAVEPEILNDLGNLYWMLSRHLVIPEQKLPYLDRAIQAYEAALVNIQPQTQTQFCAMIQNNLGAVCGDLARYRDPADNLQKSVNAYQVALEYRRLAADRTDSSAVQQYAATVNNLGTAYWNLAQHRNSVTNLKQAIATYNEAIRYYTPAQQPLEYAMIQNNLGTAYWNLAQYEQPENYLLLAISAYEVALQYRTPQVVPAACAATQNNLGTAYWHLANYYKRKPKEHFQYLQQAIAAYEATLSVAEQLANSPQPAKPLTFDIYSTHNNLALAHYQLATNSPFPAERDSRLHHLEAALHHHLQALNGWQDKPDFYETALNFVIQNIRTFYSEFSIQGQTIALSKVPANLLPEILHRL